MKRDEIKKWREATPDEIKSKISDMESQLYRLKHQLHIGQLKNVSAIKNMRREISTLKTIEGEKERKKILNTLH